MRGVVGEHAPVDRTSGLISALGKRPVVTAIRDLGADLGEILGGDYPAVFILGGDVFELVDLLREQNRRAPVCVNVDLARGVSSEAKGIRFLSRHVEGVISTHGRTVENARKSGMLTVQRLFAIDSGAVERVLKMITRTVPDFVEIADYYREVCDIPVLAGGLITDTSQVSSLLASGVSGVSTSNSGLWSHETLA